MCHLPHRDSGSIGDDAVRIGGALEIIDMGLRDGSMEMRMHCVLLGVEFRD
jgi:hypothetical protein